MCKRVNPYIYALKRSERKKCFSYTKTVQLGFYVSRLHWRRLVSNFFKGQNRSKSDIVEKRNDMATGSSPIVSIECYLMKFKAEQIN